MLPLIDIDTRCHTASLFIFFIFALRRYAMITRDADSARPCAAQRAARRQQWI